MTTNRLAQTASTGSLVRSGKTALQWAQIARDRNDTAGAAAWEKAAREGWDDEHFDPVVHDQHERNAVAWAAKKGVFTNRRPPVG